MSPYAHDHLIEDRDNLESRLDQWNQSQVGRPTPGLMQQIQTQQQAPTSSNLAYGGSRTRSRAQIRKERKIQENLKTETGIIYRKEKEDEM